MHPTIRITLVLSVAIACLSFAAAPGALAGDKRWFEGGDKVFVREHDDFVRIQEPDIHLQRAHRRYAKGMNVAAADEVEKAAAGFSYFAERAAGEDRKELKMGARALTKLADQMRRGEAGEITLLERAIADALRILAGEPPPALPSADSQTPPAEPSTTQQ